MPDTLLAVDSNFLMDLAKPRDVAFDALEVIRRRLRGVRIVATSTVLDELADKMRYAPDVETRRLAHTALSRMWEEWGVRAVELGEVDAVVARLAARRLLDEGVIPAEEHNDAQIVAEAAVLGCQLLISSDGHIRDAEAARLALALGECHLATVVVRRPGEIARMFAGR